MPENIAIKGSSWGDETDDGDTEGLPASVEEYDDKTGLKKVTEYKYNDNGKIVKTVKTYRLETLKVSRSLAHRKTWKKYGVAARDPPGPNPANTIMCEEVFMAYVTNSEKQPDEDEDPFNKLKSQRLVQCRICKGDHWTTKCPYKDTLAPLQEKLTEDQRVPGVEAAPDGSGTASGQAQKAAGGKYVPPSLRDGANRTRGETMSTQRKDERATVRVTNLSEDAREVDLEELFCHFGPISRIFLAKDKNTGQSKGFAFINFYKREDAARAIANLSGYGYHHLILNVEWAK